jgi:hypothetical protein
MEPNNRMEYLHAVSLLGGTVAATCLAQAGTVLVCYRLHTLTAEMIMATGVVGFRTVESVANVLAALQHSTHNGFPIALSDGNAVPTHMRGASYSNLVSLAQLQAGIASPLLSVCCLVVLCLMQTLLGQLLGLSE